MTAISSAHAWKLFLLTGIVLALVVAAGVVVVVLFVGAYMINCEWVMEPLFAVVAWADRVGGF